MNDVDTRVTPNFDLDTVEPEPANIQRYEGPPDEQESFRQSRRPEPPRPAPATPTIDFNARAIVRTSDDCDQLYAALAEAQAMDGYGDVEKTKTARVDSKRANITFSYDYETLADVIVATRPYLARVGVSVLQFPFVGRDSVTIRTRLTHKSGQWLENDMAALIAMPDPQAIGSGISYLRRYAQKSILNVAAQDEDDDAQQAQPRSAPRPAQRVSERPQPPQAAAAPKPNVAPVAAAPPAPIGVLVQVEEQNGVTRAKLDTGYVCSTRDAALAKALRNYQSNGARVELSCRASSDPTKYLPVLEEITQQRG
jgi:hypothetical protein